jgi:pimeloyl-ACP methyl ester carboxylesterase
MTLFFIRYIATIGLVLISIKSFNQDFVEINGNQINYERKGNGTPTILMVSGYGGPLASFDSVFNKLSELTTVVRYSRAGLGKSSYEKVDKDFDSMVSELESLIQNLSINERIILIGHSYGGLIIRSYAKRHPEKVCGLLFDDSTFEDYFDRLTPIEKDAEKIEMREHENLHSGKPVDDEFRSLWKVWHSPNNWAKWFDPMPQVPTVVLTSMKITKTGLRANDTLMEARYSAQSTWTKNKPFCMQIGLANAGHFIHEDNPKVFVESVNMLLSVIRNN